MIIAKHRNGALETIKMKFIGYLAKFANYDTFSIDAPYSNAMQPNQDFGEAQPSQTITVASRMNTMEDDDEEFQQNLEEPPF